jgi:UDP-N-acetylmuramate dehydrogenase
LRIARVGLDSNLLFADSGFHGLVIKFGQKYSKVTIHDNIITAQAGAWMPSVARTAQGMGIGELEHTAGIRDYWWFDLYEWRQCVKEHWK